MYNRLSLLLISMFIASSYWAHAKINRPHEIQVSVLNHAISLPFKRPYILYQPPGHLGGSIGLNWYFHNRGKKYYYLSANLQGFNHQFLYTGVQLYGSWNFRYAFSKYFTLSAEAGLGYFHRFNEAKEYAMKNGEYQQVNKMGLPAGMFVAGFQANWYPKNFFKSGSIFTRYQVWAFYKFAGTVPILPSVAWHVGVSYPFSKLF